MRPSLGKQIRSLETSLRHQRIAITALCVCFGVVLLLSARQAGAKPIEHLRVRLLEVVDQRGATLGVLTADDSGGQLSLYCADRTASPSRVEIRTSQTGGKVEVWDGAGKKAALAAGAQLAR